MPRSLPEWIGKSDDAHIPPRVKLRIFDKYGGRCCHCGRLISGSIRPAFDHIKALALGGQNRETNIQLLCSISGGGGCHNDKTRDDVREKSLTARKRLKHLGIKRRKGRPMVGSKDSGWKKTFSRGWVKR